MLLVVSGRDRIPEVAPRWARHQTVRGPAQSCDRRSPTASTRSRSTRFAPKGTLGLSLRGAARRAAARPQRAGSVRALGAKFLMGDESRSTANRWAPWWPVMTLPNVLTRLNRCSIVTRPTAPTCYPACWPPTAPTAQPGGDLPDRRYPPRSIRKLLWPEGTGADRARSARPRTASKLHDLKAR